MKVSWGKKIGPGVLIAAAFIGPGTITACTIAGVSFGFALLWALLFSVLATMALQEMAARLGLVSGAGLTMALREGISSKYLRYFTLTLIVCAILIGNTAYEAGNIGGAVLGLEALFGSHLSQGFPWLVGFFAFVLLWSGSYKILERVFVGLIAVMSLSFVVTAIVTKPDVGAILTGLFVVNFPNDSLLTIIALVGTTIVPYNLFLHASLVNEKWNGTADLSAVRWDTIIAIALGGLVSMAIVVCASAIDVEGVLGAGDLAKGLKPLYGKWALYFMGTGLFAAGITSSITAPLAAAYVANSCFGWNAGLKDWRFRAVWICILLVGILSLFFNIRPIEIIKFAQVANGILLPFIAVVLLWMANKTALMGNYRNTTIQNVLGIIILVVTMVLGMKSVLKVFGLF